MVAALPDRSEQTRNDAIVHRNKFEKSIFANLSWMGRNFLTRSGTYDLYVSTGSKKDIIARAVARASHEPAKRVSWRTQEREPETIKSRPRAADRK